MKHTRQQKRNRKRKLKKGLKIALIVIPVAVLIVVTVVFGFPLKEVEVSSDLNQFTQQEVKSYIDAKKIDNTLIFWLQNKIGKSREIELFEQYDVKLKSPLKVSIEAYEKKIKGYLKVDRLYYYFDSYGKILKESPQKMKSVPEITGLEFHALKQYQQINAKDKKVFQTLINVTNAIEEYQYPVKRIDISDKGETTLYIKKIQVQLGKESNLDKKLKDFKDIYNNVIKYQGVLNMKRVNEEGSYTLKKINNPKKKKK